MRRKAKMFGRFAEMAGEPEHLGDVNALRVRCQVADLHVLDHATAKRAHRQLLCEMNSAKRRRRIVSQVCCQARGRGGRLLPTKPLRLERYCSNQRITAKRFSPTSCLSREAPGSCGARTVHSLWLEFQVRSNPAVHARRTSDAPVWVHDQQDRAAPATGQRSAPPLTCHMVDFGGLAVLVYAALVYIATRRPGATVSGSAVADPEGVRLPRRPPDRRSPQQ
jgi:hypothetical protein